MVARYRGVMRKAAVTNNATDKVTHTANHIRRAHNSSSSARSSMISPFCASMRALIGHRSMAYKPNHESNLSQ